MAWVSAHEGMRDHPKTRELSRKLQCSRHEAIGILVTLWLWSLNNADRDGNIKSATAEDIADGIMYRGQSTGQSAREAAEHLLESLISAGWIDIADDGHFILHDWDFWQDQWYKAQDKRAKAAADKRKQRQGGGENDMSDGQSTGQSERQEQGQYVGQSDRTSAPNRNRNRNHNRDLNHNREHDRDGDTPPIPPAGGSAASASDIQEKRFEKFWTAYPKKTGKQAAFKSWQRIKPTAELHTKIMEAVATAKRTEQWQRENGRFIPNPATWLNQGRWDDEYAENRVPENTRRTKLEGFHMADEEEAPRPSAEEPKLTGFKRAWYEEDDADDEAVRL